MHMQVWQEVEA